MELTGQQWHAILPPSWKDTVSSWLHDDMPKVSCGTRSISMQQGSVMDSAVALRLARRLTDHCFCCSGILVAS